LEKIGRTEDFEEMAKIKNENITKAVDECTSFKMIIMRHCYRCGISKETKEPRKSRDQARNEIRNPGNERHIMNQKYKTLRNWVRSALKRNTRLRNEQRIEKAADENEV
jgi:hypothetical protein